MKKLVIILTLLLLASSIHAAKKVKPSNSSVKAINGNGVVFSYSEHAVWFIKAGKIVKSYPASGAAKGLGTRLGSNCTPTGLHTVYKKIRKKYNGKYHPHTRYVAREPVGIAKVYTRRETDPGAAKVKNQILTGVIWIIGKQTPAKRYIYFHSTNRLWAVGKKHVSHGCILLLPNDLLDLMKRVKEGTRVYIY